MKRIITLIFVLAFVFSFSACKSSENVVLSDNNSEPVKQQSVELQQQNGDLESLGMSFRDFGIMQIQLLKMKIGRISS